jgi:hypothetical protein
MWVRQGRDLDVAEGREGIPAPSSRGVRMTAKTKHKCAKTTPVLVAHVGPSQFDSSTVRVVVYSLRGSRNAKLGPMAQALICRDDCPPHHATRLGLDGAVCGDCTLRTANAGGCYVATGLHYPHLWRLSCGLAPDLEGACNAIRASQLPVRFGSHGDPAAMPFEVFEALVGATTRGGRPRHTAYTQAWRTCDQRFREYAMARVLSAEQRHEAKGLGWRTFRVRLADMPVLSGERPCPAAPESGRRTTCSRCLACSGTSSRRTRDLCIVAHGSRDRVNRMATTLLALDC